MTNYRITTTHAVMTMTADFAQAACPVLWDGHSTHRPRRAAELVLEWMRGQGDDMGELVSVDAGGES